MPRRSGRAFKGKRLKVEGDNDDVISSSVKGAGKGKEERGSAVKSTPGGGTTPAKEMGEGTSGTPAVTGTAKALGNPVILNHLFRLCTPDVLASCRQVCKLWYNESLVTWRNTCSITFTAKRGSIFLTNRYHYPDVLYVPLKKFLAYTETSSSQCITKPYRYIKIAHCELNFDSSQFEEFWLAMGDDVIILELIQCVFSDVEDFREIIFDACPNLKRLAIEECSFPEDLPEDGRSVNLEYKAPLYEEHKHLKTLEVVHSSPNSKLPISWLEFFSHFQSVTSFVFNTSSSRSRGLNQIDSLTEAIRLVRKQGNNKLPFKYFVLSPPFFLSWERADKRYLEIARELCLPVSALVIEVHPELDEDFLKDTLEFFAKSLLSIQLYRKAPTALSLQFPFEVQLNNLAHLGIENKLLEDFTFLKYIPNLDTLAIFVDDDFKQFGEFKYETPTPAVKNTPNGEMEHVRMERLEKLTLGCIVSDEDICRLFQWMPKIRNLKMILNDKQFGIVCESWRDLEKLTVLGDKLTDEGVTGRSGRQTRQKRKTGVAATATHRPNITYLQNLEKFAFMSSRLTADSVFHGFLGLPNLQLIKSYSSQIVWDHVAKNALKKRHIYLYGGDL